VNHAIAVLALSAACLVWYLVQRAAGQGEEPECEECERPGCSVRGLPDPACPEDPTPRDPR
jgi:hypothetical protein